jgi:hypothetical protein
MEGLQGRATMAAARARPVGERWGAITQVVVLARCDTPREPGGGAASEIRGQGEIDPVIVPTGSNPRRSPRKSGTSRISTAPPGRSTSSSGPFARPGERSRP